MAGCQGARRTTGIGAFPQAAGASGSPGRLATAMTTMEPRDADSLPWAQGDQGQARSQGAPGTAVGPESANLQPANPQPANPQAANPQSADPKPGGPESAHPQAVGPERANAESAGPEPAGPEPAGLEPAGLELAGP